MDDTPIIPPHVADGPAETMSMEDWNRHLQESVIIQVHEPKLMLSQGSFVRCSRRNVTETLRSILTLAPNVRLTVCDSITAAELRRRSLARG